MKQCTKCGRSYADESLNFCLDDGTLLSRSNDLQATLLNTAPRSTDPKTTEVLYPQPPPTPQTTQRTQPWAIYLIIVLGVLVIGTIGIALIVLAATNSRTTSTSTTPSPTTANSTYSREPSPTPEINLSGTWRDVYGGTSQITQTGESFHMNISGTACRGHYVSTATGTISGTRIDLEYETNYSRGQCSGKVSADGEHVSLTCTDSACGQFQTMSEKVRP